MMFYKKLCRYLMSHAERTTADENFLLEMESSIPDGDILMDEVNDESLDILYREDGWED